MAVSIDVYLDGNLVVQEPIGIRELAEHLYYSEDLSAYLLEVDGAIIFTGTEFDYLYDKFRTSVCTAVSIRIVDTSEFEVDFEGYINVSDIEFEPDIKYAVCEIQNNNITSRIENNKSIDCTLTVGRSKNDVAYSVTQQTITIYSPDLGSTIQREGIRIFDAFKSIVSFVTDGQIGFVSNYFDYTVNTDPQVYSVLTTGSELRTGNGNYPVISFHDLFNDLNSLENLALSFEDGNIRIEDKDYYKQQASSISFDSVSGLKQQLATETLYAQVKFGSVAVSSEYDYLQDIRFNCMNQESYHLGGQCNTDTTLDLTTIAIITDTNIVQDVLPVSVGGSGNDAYDENVIIVHCDSSNESVMSLKPASSTDYYMNDRFINRNVALRWWGQVPNSIYAFLGSGNDGCYIGLSVNQSGTDLAPYVNGLQCDNESPPYHDVNGNYAIDTRYFPGYPVAMGDIIGVNLMTAGFYTAPANGVYSFQCDVIVEWPLTSPFTPNFFFQRMASNTIGGAMEYNDECAVIPLGGTQFRVIGGATFYLNAGEYVGCSWIATAPPQIIYAGSTFTCFDPLGGIFTTYDESVVYQIQNQFQYNIPVDEWKTIKSLPFQAMEITHMVGRENGWLKDISRRLISGKSDVTLLSRNG